MNRVFFFIFSLLLSFSLLANSTVFVVNDQGVIRSDKIANNDKNIIKTVGKNQRLQRLTMHYSGWSLVALDGLNGWILSENLTTVSPTLSDNNLNKTVEFYQQISNELKSKVNLLERENTRLSALVTDLNSKIKVLSLLKNTSESTNVLTKVTNIDNKTPASIVDKLSVNWVYLGVILSIVFLLSLFLVYNKNKRRHFDLNTIKRH